MQYHRDTKKAKNSVPGGSWAAFFKAKTWEEMRMLAEKKPGLQSSVETLYQLNCDEQIREMSIPVQFEPAVRSLRATLPAVQSHPSGGVNHPSGK